MLAKYLAKFNALLSDAQEPILMEKFFVPYADGFPAAINIKGHRLLIVSTDEEDITESLVELGGNEIREVQAKEGSSDETQVLLELAAGIKGGVVLAPPGIALSTMITSLESELPWVQ